MPIYINTVRDPIERVISWFYYSRTSDQIQLKARKHPERSKPELSWLTKV